MEWINIKDRKPDLIKSILVAAKEGNYWPEVHGPRDERSVLIYVGYFYDLHQDFKNLDPKIEFQVECGCSGYEYDRPYLEVTHWMPLPQLPE